MEEVVFGKKRPHFPYLESVPELPEDFNKGQGSKVFGGYIVRDFGDRAKPFSRPVCRRGAFCMDSYQKIVDVCYDLIRPVFYHLPGET